MPEYKFCKVDMEGHIDASATVAECDDDLKAIKKARTLLDGHDIEVREGERIVAYLVPESFGDELDKHKAAKTCKFELITSAVVD